MTTHNMNLPVDFVIRATRSWYGQHDENGGMIDEIRYGGNAFIFDQNVAEVTAVYRTEAAAIKALKDQIKNLAAK